jgi:hypothetical protein
VKSTPELRAQWEELFGRLAPPYGRKMLEARIGYRLQECGSAVCRNGPDASWTHSSMSSTPRAPGGGIPGDRSPGRN